MVLQQQPGTIQMIESSAGEVLYLFEIMKKFRVTCSLELNTTQSADPLLGIAQAAVRAEYFERHNDESGDAVIVYLGECEFGFDLKNHSFSKHISDCQINIAISSEDYTAWFLSAALPEEGIEEANSYKVLTAESDLEEEIMHICDDIAEHRIDPDEGGRRLKDLLA